MSDYPRWGPYNNGTPAHPGELRGAGADLGAAGIAALLTVIGLGGGWLYHALTISVGLGHGFAVAVCCVAALVLCVVWRWIWSAAVLAIVVCVFVWSVIMITRSLFL